MRDEFHRFGHLIEPSLTDALFITVERHTRRPDDARPTLSADLRSEAEIDTAFDALAADLEAARREAKAAMREILVKKSA